MADVKWIKITTDVFDDEKILMIESLPSADSIIVIWFKLLTFAGKQNNDGVFIMNNRIAYTDEMLASIFRRDVNTVRLALTTFQQYGMIDIIDGVVTIPNWNKHQTLDAYERKKERDRIYQAERRANQKRLVEKSSDTSFDCQQIPSSDIVISEEDIEKDKEKDNKKINSASSNAPSKKDISEFFESIWKLYPNKKGKGQVSDSKKKTLYEIGYDELARAIERYNSDLKKEEWRKPQNGSTFFNSGYVDYLDANYSPLPEKQKERKNNYSNKFNNAPQRNYEMDALERMLLEQQNYKPETDAGFLAEAEALQRELQQKYGR